MSDTPQGPGGPENPMDDEILGGGDGTRTGGNPVEGAEAGRGAGLHDAVQGVSPEIRGWVWKGVRLSHRRSACQ